MILVPMILGSYLAMSIMLLNGDKPYDGQWSFIRVMLVSAAIIEYLYHVVKRG